MMRSRAWRPVCPSFGVPVPNSPQPAGDMEYRKVPRLQISKCCHAAAIRACFTLWGDAQPRVFQP